MQIFYSTWWTSNIITNFQRLKIGDKSNASRLVAMATEIVMLVKHGWWWITRLYQSVSKFPLILYV